MQPSRGGPMRGLSLAGCGLHALGVVVPVTLLLLFGTTVGGPPVAAADQSIPSAAINRIAAELSTRRFDPAQQTVRGFTSVFSNAVAAVPLIVSNDSVGSAVLVHTTGPAGFLVTNRHVVASPFVSKDGTPFVIAMFHDPRLARDVLDEARVWACLEGRDQTQWCATLKD